MAPCIVAGILAASPSAMQRAQRSVTAHHCGLPAAAIAQATKKELDLRVISYVLLENDF